MNEMQFSQAASYKTLFVANARMCTKAPGLCVLGIWVHFRSVPAHCYAPALEKRCLDTKCLNIDAHEINMMQSGCKAFPKLMRENECLVFGGVLEAPLLQKSLFGHLV